MYFKFFDSLAGQPTCLRSCLSNPLVRVRLLIDSIITTEEITLKCHLQVATRGLKLDQDILIGIAAAQ